MSPGTRRDINEMTGLWLGLPSERRAAILLALRCFADRSPEGQDNAFRLQIAIEVFSKSHPATLEAKPGPRGENVVVFPGSTGGAA